MRRLLTLLLLALFAVASVQAQDTQKAAAAEQAKAAKAAADAEAARKKAAEATDGWQRRAEFGFNVNGMGLRNPQVADPANQLGIGGLLDLFGNYKRGKLLWENAGRFRLSVLRNGGGDNPFAIGANSINLNSIAGYSLSSNDKWFVGAEASLATQILPLYTGGLLDGSAADLLSQFGSPLNIGLSPGIVYKPNSHLTLFASPIGLDYLYVAEEGLRTSGNLGNEIGKASRTVLGPRLSATYNNAFFKDKVTYTSAASWVPNYLDNLNGRFVWSNSLNFALVKGFGLTLIGDAFYNHYSKAFVREVPAGTPAADLEQYLGQATTLRGAFLFTYNRKF
jgi:hypothetical protein